MGLAGGRRHVALEVGRRNREDIREVVETAVRRLIPGEQRLDIEVEREQVANRVVVFRAIETMDRVDPAWIRAGRRRPVDRGFEPARYGASRGRIGPRRSGRRHRAGTKLGNDPLPLLRVGDWLGEVQAVERKSGGMEFLVMAPDAVRIEECPGIGGRGRRRSAEKTCGGGRAGEEEPDFQFFGLADCSIHHASSPAISTSFECA